MGRKSLCFLLALVLVLGSGGLTVRAAETTEETTAAQETTAPVETEPEGIPVEESCFPDEIFRAFVAKNLDADGDGLLSPREIGAVTELDVSGLGIASLRGVELFTGLTRLECQNNSLTELDLTGCKALRELRCYRNRLTELDVGGCPELRSLYCGKNSLETLNLEGNTKLITLQCQENRLSSLDVSGCPELDFLVCSDNELAFLDLSANPALTNVQAEDNESTLSVGGTLELAAISGFDPARASDWENASPDGGILTVDARVERVRFTYDLDGKGKSARFTWRLPEIQGVPLDERHFPDENFRLAVSHQLDTTPDGVLTAEEIAAAVRLEAENFKITSLEGLAYLTELQTLSCGGNALAYVDVSANPQLTDLSADGNEAALEGRWDKTVDLGAIPGFDPSRASAWEGGTAAENLLTAEADTVSFAYDADGAGKTVTMTWHLTFPALPAGTPVDALHFPDENFRAYVINTLDADGSGFLADEEIRAVTELQIPGAGICSLAGAELFSNLRTLNCPDNTLTVLPLDAWPRLESLDCAFNDLTELDLRENGRLETLSCAHNALTALNPADCPELRTLDCRDNELELLNVTRNDRLEILSCGENRLEELDVGKCPALTHLNCDYNRLIGLKLPESGSLTVLSCNFNLLTKLDAGAQEQLLWLFAGGNPLEELTLSNQCTPEKLDCPADPVNAPGEEEPPAEAAEETQPPEELCPQGHTLGPWIQQVLPTCSATGIRAHRDCTVCGRHFDKNGREIPDLTLPTEPDRHMHTQKTPRVEPTCTQDGFTAGTFCQDCVCCLSGHTTIPARHTLTAWIKEGKGIMGHFDCKICGKHFDADKKELADLTIPDAK